MNTSFNPSKFKSRLFKSIGANAYGQLINVGIQLISVPIFLHFWGVQLYGEWLILSAVPTYLSLSDIGFASVAGNDMTMRIAKGDQEGTLEVYQSIWLLICITSIIVGCIAILFAWALPITEYFNLALIQSTQASIAISVLLIYVIIGLQGGVLSAGFRCTGRYAYGTMLTNTIRLTEWILAVIALACGGDIVDVAIALLTGRTIGTIAIWFILHHQSSWLKLGYRAGKLATVHRLFKPAVAFMAFPLGLALSIQGMVLVIGIFIGPAAVAIFSAYRTLTRILVQVITLLNQAVWPEISAAYGVGNVDMVKQLHRKGSAATFWIGLVGIILLGLAGDFIITTWTRHAFEPNNMLLALLLIAGFLNILWQTSWVVLMATNRHQKISIIFIAGSTIGLITSIKLLPIFGVNGASIALIIFELPMLYFAIKESFFILNDNWNEYTKSIICNPFKRKL